MKDWASIKCEICKNSSWELLNEGQMTSVCSGREVIQNSQLVKGMCTQCGFVYTLRSPLEEDLDHYYQQVYSSKLRSEVYDYKNYSHGKTFAETLNSFVFSHEFPQKGRLLDIGCGKGFFEQAFYARYPEWQIEGVDPSISSIEMARKKVPAATFYTKNFAGSDYQANSYDLVCIHAVLNRVPSRVFVQQVEQLLKIGGMFSTEIVIFPQAPFELFFADHTCMYFREHILALMEEFHLDLVSEDTKGSKWRFLFKKISNDKISRRVDLDRQRENIKASVKQIVANWQRVFTEVKTCIRDGKKVAFYGQGTTLMIILTNTNFPKELIYGIYDDNPYKVGEVVLDTTVQPSSSAMQAADALVLCAGPEGIPAMQKNLGAYKGLVIHL